MTWKRCHVTQNMWCMMQIYVFLFLFQIIICFGIDDSICTPQEINCLLKLWFFFYFTINGLKYTIYSMKILLLEEEKGWGERMLVFAHLLVIIFIHVLNYLFDSQNYQNKPCVPYLFSISYILSYFSIGYIAS